MFYYTPNSGAMYALQGAASFNLTQLTLYSELTNLFQFYKINWIKLDFRPNMNNQVWATAAAGGPIPEIAYAKRWADGNTRSFGDLIQVSDVVYKKVTDRYTTWLKPKAAAAYYQSGVSTGYGIASPWLNMDYSNIPHYGISFATNLDNTTSIFPNNYKLELHATFYVKLRGAR